MSEAFALFTGCLIAIKYPQFELATRHVMKRCDVDLKDLSFTCCPNPVYMEPADPSLWRRIAERNLNLARQSGLPVLVLCNGCFFTLRRTALDMADPPDVVHYLSEMEQWIRDLNPERILNGMRVSTHLGCHASVPECVRIDDPLYPSLLDRLVSHLGGETLDYKEKTLCCSPGMTLLDRPTLKRMAIRKFHSLREQNCELLVVSCPTCYSAFETSHRGKWEFSIVHIMQLYAMALGYNPDDIHLHLNRCLRPEHIERWRNRFA